MAHFLPTRWRSVSTLSSFMERCILGNLVGSLCWMAFPLTLLVRLRLFGWREILRKGGVGGIEGNEW